MAAKLNKLVIVTPALASANNGNWQTARRWAQMLRPCFEVKLVDRWTGGHDEGADAMIALHARRSADAVHAWRQLQGPRPLVVVLTGTDLYRDIHTDAQAQASLRSADRLVVLNELGLSALPEELRQKAIVCLQSCPTRKPRPKARRHLRSLMVGHLRDEKSPQTYFEAARLLRERRDIRLDHIGAGLDETLATQARQLSDGGTGSTPSNYRWHGALPHAATRQRIAAAHVLVHCSRMEGGAHVVMEAITSGTAILASRIDGNVGLLGADYGGYFEWGDAAALAALLQHVRDDPAMLTQLQSQCRARAYLFEPRREQATLHALLTALMTAWPPRPD